ncbi:hypothetical protein ACN47E_009254 [Coniothyrium glycines]
MSYYTEVNPFDVLTKRGEVDKTNAISSASTSPFTMSSDATSITTNSFSNYSPSLLGDAATTYKLKSPFIHTTRLPHVPSYQLQHILDQSGRPAEVRVRRLQSYETRSCSVPAVHAAKSPRITYIEKDTLFSISDFDMHDHVSGSCVQMSSGRTLWGREWTRFWQVKRYQLQDNEDVGEGSKSLRRASKDSFETTRKLLFVVRKGVWEDAEGITVAHEEVDGCRRELSILDAAAKDASMRDSVVACWLMRIWMTEGIR